MLFSRRTRIRLRRVQRLEPALRRGRGDVPVHGRELTVRVAREHDEVFALVRAQLHRPLAEDHGDARQPNAGVGGVFIASAPFFVLRRGPDDARRESVRELAQVRRLRAGRLRGGPRRLARGVREDARAGQVRGERGESRSVAVGDGARNRRVRDDSQLRRRVVPFDGRREAPPLERLRRRRARAGGDRGGVQLLPQSVQGDSSSALQRRRDVRMLLERGLLPDARRHHQRGRPLLRVLYQVPQRPDALRALARDGAAPARLARSRTDAAAARRVVVVSARSGVGGGGGGLRLPRVDESRRVGVRVRRAQGGRGPAHACGVAR
mmetsp:Transcript_7824/g.32677  ORF Transcript_7824/g.32677 Transcript_7824/m.32677 type:complete len:323 (+) Transcript_7824:2310-3278(+)